jgi:hypothetical protein
MVGKFSNTISKNNNIGGNNNGNNSVLRGIPIVEITTPTYMVKKEDMGCMLLVTANCTLDFTNINDTSTCIIYIINNPHEINEVLVKATNKNIVGSETFANDMHPQFITIHKGKVYTYNVF